MYPIELKGISKVYHPGQRWARTALHDIHLCIAEGEACALMGASGSGKTTLLKIIGQILAPTSGECRIHGVNTAALSERKKARIRNQTIGFIFQDFGLVEDRNALENTAMPFLFDPEISYAQGKKMALEALEQVGLAHLAKERVSRLSGGERQRVAIARAMAKRHDILLADEPTGQLDTETALHIMQLLQAIQKSGTTLLVATHNPLVAAHCTRQIVLKDGAVTGDENPNQSSR